MSLKYMGVPNRCRHAEYEDKCELCKRDREIKTLQAESDQLRAAQEALK